MQGVTVTAAFDEEVGVWYVEASDPPGLNLEAATLEGLRHKLPGAVLDLLEAGPGGDQSFDLPIELTAHSSLRVRSEAA